MTCGRPSIDGTPIRLAGAIGSVTASGLWIALALAMPRVVLAHGDGIPPEPSLEGFVFGWSFDPAIWIPLLLSAAAFLWAVRRVNDAHPGNPVPGDRTIAWLAGLAAIAVALQSGIEQWDSTLFSVHMVQHLLLIFVAAPLLVLGAPITLLLRVATPAVRRRWILPALNSRVVRVVGHPLFAWLLFGAVMWGSHLSPLFDAALEDDLVHDLEHVLYLVSAILFWWPVVGRDPSPYRMGHPARAFYVFLQMPLNSFLGVLILFSTQVLYAHYATTGRPWGPTPLEDQQLAGAIMWGGGDVAFLVALLLVIAAWMRFEEATTLRREAIEDLRAAATSGAPAAATSAATSAAPAAATSAGGAGRGDDSG
jgi:cytochrome c oxidase assembly factor CtaG